MNERTVFETALEKEDPAERTAYLDTACAGDAALRQRVETLLRAHAREGQFLDVPALEQLGAAVAHGAPAAATQGQVADGPLETPSLDFLAASHKPDSLGRLGHYEVLENIGRGGMGVVLKAFDEHLHRNVAIKVLAPPLATNALARKRFVREARAAAAVRNEHVINIHAVEEANELPYLAMEYVAGVSLQERLDQSGPLQLAAILRIGMQAAAGLAAAHAQGLIHRDIKPSNILLENGVERVKITDFGLARAVDDVSLTQSGVIAGTPQYMSPEQARGEAVDYRTDLFSLGSVLYATCTGRAPFRATGTMAVLKRVCEDTPRSIREGNPETPDWLSAIIAKLQAKDPADRFQSASEVADLLSQHLAHLQQPALAPMPATQKPGFVEKQDFRRGVGGEGRPRRSRHWAVAATLLLLVMCGIGMSEATGVTQLTATVIRIFTPDGTLVVEVDDPGVKVTIEGDGGIVITGADLQEVRLRPGSYKVQAAKDGKPVRLDQELVTITRSDKQVVRVRREAPQPPKFADPKLTPAPPTAAEAKLLVELKGYDATLNDNPNDLATLLKRGRVLLQLKRFDVAVAAFSQVIMNTSDQAERKSALFNRAFTHAERGHLQGTIEDYEEWVRDGDEGALVYGRLATCYLFGPEKLRNPLRALEHAKTAIQKRGTHPAYDTLHGVCLYRLGRHRDAIEVLERAYEDKIKFDGRTAMNRFFAAMAHQSLGEPAKAQECYALALKLPQPTGHPGLIPDWVEQMRAEAEAVLKMPAEK